jgi:hypothetical protein
MGACQNLPKHVYVFLYMFMQKPKSHLNRFALSFLVNINADKIYVSIKNISF